MPFVAGREDFTRLTLRCGGPFLPDLTKLSSRRSMGLHNSMHTVDLAPLAGLPSLAELKLSKLWYISALAGLTALTSLTRR